jgi:NitT/TauT family transport system substrate-binding protein
VLVARARGLPLVIVGAVLQHDHQALLVHDENPVRSLQDLAGREVIAAVGQTWIPYLQKRYGIHFDLRPLTFGLGAFFGDKRVIQQCLVTNEPFVAAERGVAVRVLPLSDSGFDPYHVLFSSTSFVRDHPEKVSAFVRASVRGWIDYLEGDPGPAHAEILRRNPQTHERLLAYSRRELIERRLVMGRGPDDAPGRVLPRRLSAEWEVLKEFGVVDAEATLEGALWVPPPNPESR